MIPKNISKLLPPIWFRIKVGRFVFKWGHRLRGLLLLVFIILVVILLTALIRAGYNSEDTGFNTHPVPDSQHYVAAKTLWDWMQLLVIPTVLAFGAAIFNRLLDQRSRDIATDKQQQDALQAYLDKMSELLAEGKLFSSPTSQTLQQLARARTLTVLRGLDGDRKGSVLLFLYASKLITRGEVIISLHDADLSEADLHGTKLSKTYLQDTDWHVKLCQADLSGATLREANLRRVDLSGANLDNAYMSRVDLADAILENTSMLKTRLKGANLRRARLKGAILYHTDLREADLQGADLEGADIQKIRCEKTHGLGNIASNCVEE